MTEFSGVGRMPASLLFYPIPAQPTAPGSLSPCATQSPVLSLPCPSNPRAHHSSAQRKLAAHLSPCLLPPCHASEAVVSYPSHSQLHWCLQIQPPCLQSQTSRRTMSLLSQGRESSCFQLPKPPGKVRWGSNLPTLSRLRRVLLWLLHDSYSLKRLQGVYNQLFC